MSSRPATLLTAAALIAVFSFYISCTEQHRPEEHRRAIKEERLAGNQPIRKLNADGTEPKDSTMAQATSGNPKYDSLCASCHGIKGDANTPTAQSMSPKPRNFTDAQWQASVDDSRIRKVISEGGASVGLSATMAPWGSMVQGEELEKMLETVRGFSPEK